MTCEECLSREMGRQPGPELRDHAPADTTYSWSDASVVIPTVSKPPPAGPQQEGPEALRMGCGQQGGQRQHCLAASHQQHH